MSELERLRSKIQPLRLALLEHPLYGKIQGLGTLRLFMEQHVFAVWDFMSLLKSLQQRLCCVTVPWVPRDKPLACRFVNEIVLGEESDEDGQGGFASHFELYRSAMQQCGASTVSVDSFLSAVSHGKTLADSLQIAKVGEPVRRFVMQTFETANSEEICVVASAFTFGREDLLPGVFRRIVEELNTQTDGRLDRFRYYLERHIHLDDEQHGPMAARLVSDLCGSDAFKWKAAEEAALMSLQARLDLWNAMSDLLARG